MVKRVFGLATIAIAVCVSANLASGALNASIIARKYSPSVVTIVALDEHDQPLSLGSGFFVNAIGHIATNHHVLEGSARAIVKTSGGQEGHVIQVIKDDPNLDLLIAETSLRDSVAVPLGDSDTITVGQDIVAIGNPAGLEGTVSKGIISGVRKAEGTRFIQITAPISPGSSGGPVFNLSGLAIGVATAYLDLGQNLNFAMPINYLKTLKPNLSKLSSLARMPTSLGEIESERTLVEVFDKNYNRSIAESNALKSLTFSIRNRGNLPVRNVQLFFVYKKNPGMQVIDYSAEEFEGPVLPKLARRFTHEHFVPHFYVGYSYSGMAEVRILDYEICRSGQGSAVDFLLK